jgi:hypothetical protein
MAPRSAPARGPVAVLAALAAMALLLAACGSGPASPSPTSAAPVAPRPSVQGLLSPFPAGSLEPLPTTAPSDGPAIGSAGAVAVLENDLSLSLVQADGRTTVLASAADGTFAFPAWSPDGSRIAAIRYGPADRSILVFDAAAVAAGATTEPTVIFRSTTVGPFYLSWLPDGERVSYLATDTTGALSLRVAPADGSGSLDGTGEGATIQTGDPFYFDWTGNDGLFAHIGTGTGAFLGELGLDGVPTGDSLPGPGDFRSAVLSPDRDLVSFVRTDGAGASEVVVSSRDGSTGHAVPVYGIAAMAFEPTGDLVATIGADAPITSPLAIPVGPLRLIDPADGQVRTLLDGQVVSFWWSPDGRTIAALRVHETDQVASASAGTATGVAASPPPRTEVRLEFVDVASGEVTAQMVVTPGTLFINQLLNYFDQYTLSHELWAPDSASILMPVVDPEGITRVAVVFRDGAEPVFLHGQAAFWSP